MKIVKKETSYKRIFFLSLILTVILSAIGCGKKEEDYRQIQVYKIEGTATVVRQGSSMDAYENMQLQSGDIVETVTDTYLQLKLDEDKYILVEPDSKIVLQATGNSVDSKTSIFLEKGAIVNQLDNPLSKASSYEVTTPNSTMAVRGTTFRVEITYDESGESFAKVAVYGGKVECNLVFPDGTVKEPVTIEPGVEVLVRGDDVESEYVTSGTTSYEELKEKVLDFLEVVIDKGKELSITPEEIEMLREAIIAIEEEEATIEEVTEEEKTEEEETPEPAKKETSLPQAKEPVKEEPQEKPAEPTPPTTTTPSDVSSEDNASSGDSSSTEDNSSSGSGGSSSSESTTPSTRNVTITFLTNTGTKFAEIVQNGITTSATEIPVTKPTLQPTASGSWKLNESDAFPNGAASASVKLAEGVNIISFIWSP